MSKPNAPRLLILPPRTHETSDQPSPQSKGDCAFCGPWSDEHDHREVWRFYDNVTDVVYAICTRCVQSLVICDGGDVLAGKVKALASIMRERAANMDRLADLINSFNARITIFQKIKSTKQGGAR